jgi:hypothetical protein
MFVQSARNSAEKRETNLEKGLAMSSQHQLRPNTPDCLVVHRTVSGAPGWPTVNQLLSGNDRGVRLKFTGLSGGAPDCPVVHRTVR